MTKPMLSRYAKIINHMDIPYAEKVVRNLMKSYNKLLNDEAEFEIKTTDEKEELLDGEIEIVFDETKEISLSEQILNAEAHYIFKVDEIDSGGNITYHLERVNLGKLKNFI